ncbi:MAG TPA: hypothetical protein VE442_02100 [Jatrophihabitans sp.]|jgi:small-conductance mechanosensitive channel|nr:hypothetical protein [Jatrophihabitans sp.]
MRDLRDSPRRAPGPCGGQASASPSPVAVPLLVAAALIATVVIVAVVFDLSVAEQVAIFGTAGLASFAVLHRTLLSLLAGLALAVIRPYGPGERIRLHSPSHGGEVEAVIVRIGPVNTTLATDICLLFVPNYLLLKDAG